MALAQYRPQKGAYISKFRSMTKGLNGSTRMQHSAKISISPEEDNESTLKFFSLSVIPLTTSNYLHSYSQLHKMTSLYNSIQISVSSKLTQH